jgi:hypothetical protein
MYRTGVPLPYRCCILYIFPTNISTEYFKHVAHSPFFSSKCRLFHNATFFGSCIIHILHAVVNKHFRLHRIKRVQCCVFVLVLHRTKHGNIVLEHGQKEIFGLKTKAVAGGWTKLHTGELHEWYWLVNAGGWWTDNQWDRWDKRNALEKLQIHTKFQLEALREISNFGDQDIDEMWKSMW